VAVDSTTLEANAAMKSIVRKDTGEDWQEYLRRLAHEAGIEDPTDEDLRRFDQKRKDKKVSNADWESTTDPGSRITKMKDGTTHLAYKAEHVVDVDTDFVLAATVHGGDVADTTTLVDSVVLAQVNLDAAHGVRRERDEEVDVPSPQRIREVVADKGYHDDGVLELCGALDLRTYVPERRSRYRRRWQDKPPEYQAAVYANRRRVGGARSKRLQRLRSEMTERSFAHVCETGGGRRCWLRGLVKVTKRYLLQVAARNLGLILRKLFGIGSARSLQGSAALVGFAHLVGTWLPGMYWSLRCRAASGDRMVSPRLPLTGPAAA
jgi:transposase